MMDPYQAIEYAVELLLKTGFVFRYQSMKTEARYYNWPGDEHNVIRVAAHKHDRGMPGLGRVVVRVVAAFRAETGNRWEPGKTGIDKMIDQATGADHQFIKAFIAWFNVAVWGPLDGPEPEG